MASQRLVRLPQLGRFIAPRSSTLRPLLAPQPQRSLHRTALVYSNKPIRDVGTGADPGYTHPTAEEEQRNAPDVPRPSHLSDPFPLPFDPRLEGMSLASASQNESLAGAPSWEGGPPEITAEEASAGYETPVPIRVPGRGPNDEDRTTRIARLVYQARKRGTLETDLLLSTFAKTHLKELSDKELLEFDLVSLIAAREMMEGRIHAGCVQGAKV